VGLLSAISAPPAMSFGMIFDISKHSCDIYTFLILRISPHFTSVAIWYSSPPIGSTFGYSFPVFRHEKIPGTIRGHGTHLRASLPSALPRQSRWAPCSLTPQRPSKIGVLSDATRT